jgi:hypothetical protein
MRLINSLGAKEEPPPLQVFITTHSPIALRELSAEQLYVLRKTQTRHELRNVGSHDDMQSTIRACPEAFLSESVIVCEGASEIGLLRGLDLYRADGSLTSMGALGVGLADGHGDTTYRRANTFAALGYRTLILRDNDKPADPSAVAAFGALDGSTLTWRNNRALEQELFASLSETAVQKLTDEAVENVGEELVDAHIKSVSSNALCLSKCRSAVTTASRVVLGNAAKTKKGPWFKSVTAMETVGRRIVGPDLLTADLGFREIIANIFTWVDDGNW